MSRIGAGLHSVGMAIATLLMTISFLLGQDPSWMNLGHIDHGNTYYLILRNGSCLQGTIRSVNPDTLSLAVLNPGSKNRTDVATAPRLVTVARSDALQVKDGLNQFDILYSGRSSWRDVRAVPSHSREYFSITLKSRESFSGEPTGSTDSQLSVKRSKSAMDIAKTDIALVDYVRIKPAPANRLQEFPVELFDPRNWPFIFNVGVQLRVPLFDSTLPEDDSILQCPNS